MCGIAGYFAFADTAAPPADGVLERMRDRMRRRGPDGAGLWFSPDRRVGFAHRRLSIIELSDAGAQPMVSADGRYTIIFNGEIYNYAALRDTLIAQGRRFRGHSDTEVLIALFDCDGVAMLDHLRGMYAIAIWDAAERRMTLARDPYGIKPLFFTRANGCLRFASQVKALLEDPTLSRTVDPAGLVGFHMFGSVPEPFTLYRDIAALPAGCVMTIDAGGVSEPRRFATLGAAFTETEPRAFDPAAAAEALRDSVAHHMVADVDVGLFLSGGVDSGALLGLMRDAGASAPVAATLSYEESAGTPTDEAPHAAQIAAHYGARHHVRTVTAAEFRDDMPDILDLMDQPSVDGVNVWFASKAVREQGVKVALSGLGGEELFAGYSTFQTVPATHRRFGAIGRVPFAGAAARATLRALAPGLVRDNPKVIGLFDLPASWAGTYLLRRAVLMPFELDTVLDAGVVREGLARLAPVDLIRAAITPDPGSDVGRVSVLESSFYMRNQLLRDADWAGMAHSLEIRVPLVDYTLLRRIAPMAAAIRPGMGKAALADAPATPLPRSILDKPKTGFSIPLMSWMSGTGRHVPNRLDSRRWASHVLAAFDDLAGLARTA